VKVEVDAGKCQGHNRCYAMVPDVFQVDDFGQASVRGNGEVPEALTGKVRLAAANCPEHAITIVE
jgi:ferredoxin